VKKAVVKRKPRGKGDSFVLTLPLATTPDDERALNIRLDAARQIFNAGLGESLRRLNLMRETKAWQSARQMARARIAMRSFTGCNTSMVFRIMPSRHSA